MGEQTPVQRAVLAILPKVSSVLSMSGSTAILAECFYFERKRLKRVYNRLLCVMAIFDILESIFNFASTWMVTEGSGKKFAAGNVDSCTAQGFFLQLGLTSPVLNAFLSWYYLLVIRYSWSEEDIKEKAEPWIYRISLLVGFGTSIAGVLLDLYHPGDLWCWIGPDPDSKLSNTTVNTYRYTLYFGPLFACFFIIAFNMGLLTFTVRKLENASKRYMSAAYKKKVNKKTKKSLRQSLSAASSQSDDISIGKSIMNFMSGKKTESEDAPLPMVPEGKRNISEKDKTSSERFRDLIKKQDEIKKKMESNSSDMSKIMELKRKRKSMTIATSTASKQSAANARALRRSVSVDETLRKQSNSRALYSFLSTSSGENPSPHPTFKPSETPISEETPLSLDEDEAPETITNKSLLTSTRDQNEDSTPLTSFPGGDESETESPFPGEEEELAARVDGSLPGGDKNVGAPLNVDEQEKTTKDDVSLPERDEKERAGLSSDELLQIAREDASLTGGDDSERAPSNIDAKEQTARTDMSCSDEDNTLHSILSNGQTSNISKSENINDALQFSSSVPNSDNSSIFPPIGSLAINSLQMKSTPILSKEALRRSSTTSSIRSSLRSNLEWSEFSFLPAEKDIDSIRKHLQELTPDQSLNSEQTAIRSNSMSRAEASRRASESDEPLSFHMRSNFSVGEPSSFSSASGKENKASYSVKSMREAFRNSKSVPEADNSYLQPNERKAKKKPKRKTKSTMVTEQALFYVLSFLLTFMWSIGSRLFQLAKEKPPYFFLVGQAFFDPLQGFINYLVYIRPKLISYRKRNPHLTRLQCIKALITHVDVEKDDDKETEEGAQKELLRWRKMKNKMEKPKQGKTVEERSGRGSIRFAVENSSDIEDHRLMEEEERDAREDSLLNDPIVDIEHQ